MKKEQLTIKEMLDLINGQFNARQKKSAAKFVAQFKGYEGARVNEGTEWEGSSVIIIPTSEKYSENITLEWDSEYKEWTNATFGVKPAFHTPDDVIKSNARYAARNYEDKLVRKSWGEVKNRAIINFNIKKSNELSQEARRLERLVWELDRKASEYRSKTY